LYKFAENNTDCSLPVTDELNADEIIKLKKLIAEIPSSLAFIKCNPDMLHTCGYVAESSFAEICEIVGYNGIIFDRLKKRHAAARSANMGVYEIEKEIGSQFPIETARETMSKIVNALYYFCVENVHSMAKDICIDRYGCLRMTVQWVSDSEDLKYVYYFEPPYKEPSPPTIDVLMKNLNIVTNSRNGIKLLDNIDNKEGTALICSKIGFFDVDSIKSSTDIVDVNGVKRSVFVIDSISFSTNDIIHILDYHDKFCIESM
jgi:hypothetical protein